MSISLGYFNAGTAMQNHKMATEPIYSLRLPYQFQGSTDQTVIIMLSSLYLPNINHVSLRLADIVQLQLFKTFPDQFMTNLFCSEYY